MYILHKHKKTRAIIVVFLCMAVVICCSSCKTEQQKCTSFPEDFEFGVIETADTFDQSILTYYDENFEIVHTEVIGQGNLSDGYRPGLIDNHKLYLAPYGKSIERSTHSLLSIDLEQGQKQEYIFGKRETGIMGMAVSETFAYVCSNLNGDSTLSCANLRSKERLSKTVPNAILDDLYVHGDILYASAIEPEEERCYLYEFDAKTLELLHKTDLNSPLDPASFTVYNNKLYFTMDADKENYVLSKNQLGCYDIKQKTITWIDFSEQKAMGKIAPYKDLLMIAHTEMPLGTGNRITAFDPKTGEKETIPFKDLVSQMEIQGNYIYILSHYSGDGSAKVYKCMYSKGELKTIAAADVYTQKENEKMYYVGSFFVNDKESSNEKE